MSIDPAVTEELRDVLATMAASPGDPVRTRRRPWHWDSHARLIRRLIDNGITLVTPNGNTGEFYTLSAEETGPPPSPRSGCPGPRGGAGGAAQLPGMPGRSDHEDHDHAEHDPPQEPICLPLSRH